MSSNQPEVRSGVARRIDGIDLIRGLAVFFVLMNHVNMRLLIAKIHYLQGLPPQLAEALVWNGQRGVQMFFAVSGFLITSITLRRWKSLAQIRVRDFYLMRFARIAPLLFLLLAVLTGLHFAGVQNFVVAAKTGGIGRALLAAVTFHVNVLEANRGYLPGNWDILWSLSVEEMFYLFFPLACWLLGRSRLFVGLLLAFVVLGPVSRSVLAPKGVWHEYSYLGSMDAIALGCLTALILSQVTFSRRALRILGGVGSAILIFCLAFSLSIDRSGLTRLGLDMTVLAFGTCLFVAAAAQSQWKGPRIISPLLKIGQYSYEIYLTHMFVVFALFGLFLRTNRPMWLVPVLFVATLLTSAFLGGLVANLYSEPLNNQIRNYSRLSGRPKVEVEKSRVTVAV